MSIINDSHAIGVDTRNLVLKTRGTLHVKVGDRFYEIDFRNLTGSKEDDKDKIKEEYVISVDSKNEVEGMEYPGDNKLIIGLDGTLFVTKNNEVIEVTPKTSNSEVKTTIRSVTSTKTDVTDIASASVSGKLHNENGYYFNFATGDVRVSSLEVKNELTIPDSFIKNKCCKTHTETLEDGSVRVARKYSDYDFIEIIEIPEFLVVKSGALIKSSVYITIPVLISSVVGPSYTFENGGLYIAYEQKGEVIITKLN